MIPIVTRSSIMVKACLTLSMSMGRRWVCRWFMYPCLLFVMSSHGELTTHNVTTHKEVPKGRKLQMPNTAWSFSIGT